MMLRKILISLGLLITLLPYLGFPAAVDTVILTTSGLMIIFLLMFGRKIRVHHDVSENMTEPPHRLHVKRLDADDTPQVHVERKTIVDIEEINETPHATTTVEKMTTVTRRKRRSTDNNAPLTSGGE